MDVLSFETEVRQLIGLQQEGEYWDFKKEWHQNKADLLHDIICMANNLSNQDGLIIIGVDEENDYSICDVINDPNRRKTQDIVSFLREKKFAGGIRPTAYVQPVTLWKKTIDIIVIRNDRNTPYYLTEQYQGVYTSPLDELFERLEMREPDHIAVKYYKDYHSGSAKTLKSIQITLAARLEKFNLSSLAALTATDELDLPSLGEKKVALFALIPDNDTSFNFLVSILYTQLFQQLFYLADHKYGGSLPVPVHFLMDEFSNVSLPEDFSKILAVMRSRNVYVSIILQNVAALKALFEKEWESILGNCDEFLYLGGNETSTHKLISESYLGKSTIDTNTYGKSSGRNGNYSTNYQISGRELLMPDEVRMLDNRYALLFIRGERPVMDEKYDILKHPNIALTEDGGAAPYEHGGTENAVATLSFAGAAAETLFEFNEPIPDYELLSDEDIEALF